MQLGRFLGIFTITLGLVFSRFAFSMLRDAGFTLRLFTAGPALVIVAIAFRIFPGGTINLKENRGKTKDPQIVLPRLLGPTRSLGASLLPSA